MIIPKMHINLNNIKNNFALLQAIASPTRVSAVIKGNAYGLGRTEVARALFGAGCREFFVADWQEVLDLPSEILPLSNIYALSGVEPSGFHDIISHRVIPMLHRIDQVESWARIAGPKQLCGIQVNMGLNRLGIDIDSIGRLASIANIGIVLNHLSCGYNMEHESNKVECDLMKSIALQYNLRITITGSCGFLLDRGIGLDGAYMVRAGRLLYGIIPSEFQGKLSQIKHCATLYAVLISIRHVKKGQHIGYNEAFLADHDMEIGILNIGYSSGYRVSSAGQVAFNSGVYYRIVSQSMDFTTIDITNTRPKIGDEFELFGANITQDFGNHIALPGLANIRRVYQSAIPEQKIA